MHMDQVARNQYCVPRRSAMNEEKNEKIIINPILPFSLVPKKRDLHAVAHYIVHK